MKKVNYIFNNEIIHTDNVTNYHYANVIICINDKLYTTTQIVESVDTDTINVHLKEYRNFQYIEE